MDAFNALLKIGRLVAGCLAAWLAYKGHDGVAIVTMLMLVIAELVIIQETIEGKD